MLATLLLVAVERSTCVPCSPPQHGASDLDVGRMPGREGLPIAGHPEAATALAQQPIAFVPNLGQWSHPARFVAQFGAMTVFLEQHGWSFTLATPARREEHSHTGAANGAARGVAVRMTFLGADTRELAGERTLPGLHHYFLGADAARWRTNVPLYGAVRYRGVHPGVDVCAREHDGRFEYDLLLAPDAPIEPIEVAVEGVERLWLDRDGTLVMDTAVGEVRMPAPCSWEEGPSGEKRAIACEYVLLGDHRFGFVAPGRQPGWALVVDPGLVWSTYLGTAPSDGAYVVELGAQGEVTIGGFTRTQGFPTTPGAFDLTFNGGQFGDGFVTRLSSSAASLVYSTYFGGTGDERVLTLALDAQGGVTFGGETSSSDLPTTAGAFDTSYNGGIQDGYVARLSPSGSSLVYSTFLGGTGQDSVGELVVDAQGATTAVGGTENGTFPVTAGAFDTTYNGGFDSFVAQLVPAGSALVFSTFLGGPGDDGAGGVAVTAQGEVVVTGGAGAGFPTTPGAFDTTHNGGGDAFVARLSATGTSLTYSTFLGGQGTDWASSLAIDAQGAVTIAGTTASFGFPTTAGAFDTSFNGNGFGDAFVARLSAAGALVYSTFLGGTDGEEAWAVAVDARGAATVVGITNSASFPTTPGALDGVFSAGIRDGFVTRLAPNGSRLEYSTFLGDMGDDEAYGVTLDALGAATVVGLTSSFNFPITPGVFDPTFNGFIEADAFVTRLDLLPTGVTAFGTSSPGCNGPLPMSVNSMPRVGNATFALTCGNAAPSAIGLIAFTDAAFAAPVPLLGVDVWIDPTLLLVTATVTSDANGACEAALPIPANPTVAGVRFCAQFLWLGPASPAPCPSLGFSASNALDFTVQP